MTHITEIVTQLRFRQPYLSTNQFFLANNNSIDTHISTIFNQALATAEDLAPSYAQKATQTKSRLWATKIPT